MSSTAKRADFRLRRKSLARNLKKLSERYPVFYDGKNVTPKLLNPLAFKDGRERQLSILNISKEGTADSLTSATILQSTTSISKLNTELHLYSIGGSVGSGFQQLYISDTFTELFSIEPEREESESISSVLVEERQDEEKMPSKISLILRETETFFILDISSATAEKDTEEGIATELENKEYEYLTIGKGRNRKVVDAEIQTTAILLKSRETEAEKARISNDYAYASGWDMYDTYKKQSEETQLDQLVEGKTSHTSIDSYQMPSEEKQMLEIIKTDSFLDALCVMERLLANNNFNYQQKRFRGLIEPDPLRDDIQYEYRLQLLWTFANDKTQGRCVTAASWSTSNEDVLAVGYGKFYYTDKTTGMVMLWNIKNPVQPERTYNFAEPVTSLDFSKQHPNLLAVGFYNGFVRVIDVSAKSIRLVGSSNREDCPLFEPIWQLHWYTDDDYYKGVEFLMCTSQDGRISKFSFDGSAFLTYSHMMRVSRAEGKLKGLQIQGKCIAPGIPIARHQGALVMTPHPIDSMIYYVGTSEGVVHKCSKNYYHQHLDLFLAHEGPMYQIKFSPFCTKLFLTCGDDWAVRIWAEGIQEPLLELSKTMQTVQSADWSPRYSTIIANVSATDIFIWDLQRKTYAPQSITKSPSKCRSTIVKFTSKGRCLLVADIEGNVHIFSLEDMPFPAFYQCDLLTQAIKRELVIKPDLLKQVNKLDGLEYDTSMLHHFR